MRRLIYFVMVIALMMSLGCSAGTETVAAQSTPVPAESTPEVTPEPTPSPTPSPTPEPPSEPGTALIDSAEVLLTTLNRGDTVSVTGEMGDYYVIDLNGETGYLEKWLLRMEGEETPEERKGYAKSKAKVFKTAYCLGEPVATLKKNTPLQVIDEFGSVLLVQWDEQQGYMLNSQFSKKKISSGGGGSGSSGGGGGGSADGGDIVLGFRPSAYWQVMQPLMENQEAELPFAPGLGTVLSDETEVYAVLIRRGETLKVTEKNEEVCTVLMEGRLVELSRQYIRLEGEEAYEVWDGYARSNAPFYGTKNLTGTPEKLKKNTKVQVLEEFGETCLVQVEDRLGYMETKQVSKKKISSGSSSGGSGSSGGGGGGDWTAPVL